MFTAKEMFQRPEIPKQYNNLLHAIEQIKSENFEYAEPLSGLNRQALQLMDLDGDSIDEGVALMRNVKDGYKICIYIFRQNSGVFEVFDVIESTDDEIYTVSYSNLLGMGNFEMIVEWGDASLSSRPLSVYRISEYGAEQILNARSDQYTVSDIDQDGINDLAIARSGEGSGLVDIYRSYGTELKKEASVPLAEDSGQILRMKSGGVANGQNGVYVECAADEGGVLTSLITSENGQFINALKDGVFCSVRALCEDVNSDGIIEIPVTLMTEVSTLGLNKCYNWCAYVPGKGTGIVAFTYHSFIENWYLTMPISWSGAVSTKRSAHRTGQIAVDFYSQEKKMHEKIGDNFDAFEPEPIFTVYIFTGEARKDHARQGELFILHEREDMIFAAEIHKESYINTEINEEFIKSGFKIRESEWISEILFA